MRSLLLAVEEKTTTHQPGLVKAFAESDTPIYGSSVRIGSRHSKATLPCPYCCFLADGAYLYVYIYISVTQMVGDSDVVCNSMQ